MRFIGFYDYTVILTYMSLVSAVCGMTFAGQGRFTAAVLCLFFCGFCDAFDGTVARSKKNRTDDEKAFGIQIDSLCDCISFGVFPAMLCYFMGVNGVIGTLIISAFSLCAVIRLGFFNVMEAKRQQTEEGGNKIYRGLPVTSIAALLPFTYLFHNAIPEDIFVIVLHALLAVVAFLFIFDFTVKKPDITKIFSKAK